MGESGDLAQKLGGGARKVEGVSVDRDLSVAHGVREPRSRSPSRNEVPIAELERREIAEKLAQSATGTRRCRLLDALPYVSRPVARPHAATSDQSQMRVRDEE